MNTFWQECTIYVKSNVVGGVRNTEGAVILVHIINYETFPVNTCDYLIVLIINIVQFRNNHISRFILTKVT